MLVLRFHCLRVFFPLKTIEVIRVVTIIGIPPAVAAVATDAVTTVYHGITRRAEVKKNETVFLFGLGGLGFNALQIVRHIGARVIVSDVRQEKLDAALHLGVPAGDIVPIGKSVQSFVQEKGLQGTIDTVLDIVGKHQTFEDAQQIGRFGILKTTWAAHSSGNKIDN
jgi:propanol-preferring alcohol dehydrogenase